MFNLRRWVGISEKRGEEKIYKFICFVLKTKFNKKYIFFFFNSRSYELNFKSHNLGGTEKSLRDAEPLGLDPRKSF